MISAIVLTKNEENNIVDCLESLLWCDEIVIIDDYSDDRTLEIVRKVNKVYKVFRRHLNNNFSSQRNFGLTKAHGDWVFFVDADERVTDKLANEINLYICHAEFSSASKSKKILKQVQDDKDKMQGFYLKRSDFFLGRWLKHGETANVKLLRLAKKRSGKWSGKVHEEWKIKGETQNLSHPLLHYPHQTIGEFLGEVNRYSTIRAEELYQQGINSDFWSIIFYPKAKFLQNYFLRFGFLDGMPGLIMALIMSFHSFLVRGKLYLLWKTHESH